MVISHVIRLAAEDTQVVAVIIPIVPVLVVNHMFRFQIEILGYDLAGLSLALAVRNVLSGLILPYGVIAGLRAENPAL